MLFFSHAEIERGNANLFTRLAGSGIEAAGARGKAGEN
jgi:hypothetical protein